MWNGKRLMQVEMPNISTNEPWARKPKLSIHICSIHINLPSSPMDLITDLLDILFKNSMSRWVCYHDAGQLGTVLLAEVLYIFELDVSELITSYRDDFEATDVGSCWVSTMR